MAGAFDSVDDGHSLFSRRIATSRDDTIDGFATAIHLGEAVDAARGYQSGALRRLDRYLFSSRHISFPYRPTEGAGFFSF